METRDFNPLDPVWLSGSRDALLLALRRWQAAWGTDEEVGVQAHAAHEAAPLPVAQSWWRTAGGDTWLGVDTAFDAGLARKLFPSASTGASAIAATVAVDARMDLWAAIGAALQSAGEFAEAAGEAPEQSLRRGSGAIALRVRIGDQQLNVIRDRVPPQRRAAASSTSPCVTAQDALRHCSVGLQVNIGKLQLRLESLASIGIGDVLRLDQRLDEPAQVTVQDGAQFCEAYLGSAGAHRALSLIRAEREPAARV